MLNRVKHALLQGSSTHLQKRPELALKNSSQFPVMECEAFTAGQATQQPTTSVHCRALQPQPALFQAAANSGERAGQVHHGGRPGRDAAATKERVCGAGVPTAPIAAADGPHEQRMRGKRTRRRLRAVPWEAQPGDRRAGARRLAGLTRAGGAAGAAAGPAQRAAACAAGGPGMLPGVGLGCGASQFWGTGGDVVSAGLAQAAAAAGAATFAVLHAAAHAGRCQTSFRCNL